VEQQHQLLERNYRYQPRDHIVRQHYQGQGQGRDQGRGPDQGRGRDQGGSPDRGRGRDRNN
jgi:hypothetical protein